MDTVWVRELEGRLNAVEGQVERLNDIIGSLMGRLGMMVVEGPFVLQDSNIDKLEELVHGSRQQLGFGRGGSDVPSDGRDNELEDGD